MHASAMAETTKFAAKYVTDGMRVADIGSQDVNGSLRPIFKHCEYIGYDIGAGKGVDVVMANPEWIPAADGSIDAVVSANALEHARKPWRLVQEMARILKPGGYLILIMPMPNAHAYHAHPIDCWRCYTEGMRGMFDDAGLETIDLYEAAEHDTVGIARKP